MLFLYALTIFLGAVMLFVSELMFGRLILPLLGGTPAVWVTCMVYFQFALLAGYTYAHLASAKLNIRRQMPVHILLLALPLLLLPVAIPKGWNPPVDTNPIPWILLLMTITIGAPFMLVSATAPILQRWFAYSDHPAAKDPYFLYAASNAGSFVGLIGYIAVIEPHLALPQQGQYWEYSYYFLALLIILCALALSRSLKRRELSAEKHSSDTTDANESKATAVPDAIQDRPITRSRILKWLLLAAIPSSLMLGLTTYLTTDVAAVPLIWVIPLSLYLLSFVFAFSGRRWAPNSFLLGSIVVLVVIKSINVLQVIELGGLLFTLKMDAYNIVLFCMIALACHRLLQMDRPATKDITKFYLTMSVGGVVGGMVNALIAPFIFRSSSEFPIVLAIASVVCLQRLADCRLKRTEPDASPTTRPKSTFSYMDAIYIIAFLLFFIGTQLSYKFGPMSLLRMLATSFAVGIVCLAAFRRPIRFGACLLIIFMLPVMFPVFFGAAPIFQVRNFFGVTKVVKDSRMTSLYHGSTLHGAQFSQPELRRSPLTYYTWTGPVGQYLTTVFPSGSPKNVGLIGLGAGTLATYFDAGDRLTCYEINPVMEQVASDPEYFTYVSDARYRDADVQIVLGDGRLSIKDAPENGYDSIILDAFTSDYIPIHLLTREAIRIYMSKLADNGSMIFHISNRFADLSPVVGNVAAEEGMKCYIRSDEHLTDADRAFAKKISYWVVVTRRESNISQLLVDKRWKPVHKDPSVTTWTDDYANLLQIFVRTYRNQK